VPSLPRGEALGEMIADAVAEWLAERALRAAVAAFI
jgi:hypothetical protein